MQWNPTSEIGEHSTATKGASQENSSTFRHHDSGLGKEIVQEGLYLPKHESDLSLYGSSPKQANRQPLEDLDANTQDSGYGDGGKFFTFAQSLGVTPQSSWSAKRSFGSMDSMDEEFMEFTNLERIDENAQLPNDFNTLICGKLVHGNSAKLCQSNEGTPSRVSSDSEFRAFKRPKAETKRPALQRSVSVSEENIKCAVQRSCTEVDLIGDFSKAFCLPLTSGRHPDLKSITPTTLASLIKGEFNHLLDSYKIIDCRFPYEFEGGHAMGATNLYTKNQILELLNENVSTSRHVLIFHCEFSSERAPNLCRFLRNLDRIRNKDAYPTLNYPEIYLLEGGYKNFYEQCGDLCVPRAYKPMLHPEHHSDLRYFKAKVKSSIENRFHPSNRGKFKRLGFM